MDWKVLLLRERMDSFLWNRLENVWVIYMRTECWILLNLTPRVALIDLSALQQQQRLFKTIGNIRDALSLTRWRAQVRNQRWTCTSRVSLRRSASKAHRKEKKNRTWMVLNGWRETRIQQLHCHLSSSSYIQTGEDVVGEGYTTTCDPAVLYLCERSGFLEDQKVIELYILN